jgi:hypothetical protein
MPQLAAPAAPAREHRERRWTLIGDVLIFQVKMLLEALRDVLLPVATVVAGGVGIILGGERPERYFHEVLRLGARFDVWLNLFGPIGHPGRAGVLAADAGVDRTLRYLENLLREQHRKGQVTRQAKQAIDRWLDQVEGVVGSARGDRDGKA